MYMAGRITNLYEMGNRLIQKRLNGENDPIWKLTPIERDYIEEIGFRTKPWIYEISTREMYGLPKNPTTLMKSIYNARMKGVRKITRRASEEEVRILEAYGIKCVPVRYRIFL